MKERPDEEITIDKGVSLPRGGRKNKYPLRTMEVDDSFFVVGKSPGSMGSCITYARLSTGFAYKCRNVTENGVNGVRVWRVEQVEIKGEEDGQFAKRAQPF